jgi:hypothetical protein
MDWVRYEPMGGYCEHGNEPGQIRLDIVRLEAHSAVLKKTSILSWDIMLSNHLKVNRRFVGYAAYVFMV